MEYVVWQVPSSNFAEMRTEVMTHPSDFVPNKNEYLPVYKDELGMNDFKNDMEVLEFLFGKFNIEKPYNYASRSLSVSDVIQLDNKIYLCQSVGWDDITDYWSKWFV